MLNVKSFIRLLVLAIAMLGAPLTLTLSAQQPATSQPAASQPPASTPAQTPPAARPAPRPPAAQDEFVPVEDLPESEKLPAAQFLIAAYTIVWVVLLVYVWSLWRRLTQVERELKQAVQSAARD
jgi:CcmD family protein